MLDSASPTDDHAFLRHLAESLGRALTDNGGGFLVHVVDTTDGPDVGILPLDGQAPAEALLCTVAPPEWSALGTATGATAWPLTGRGPSSRAEVVVLVPRRGEVVARMSRGGRVFTDPPSSGVTLDCLQRSLGLPTAAPEVPAMALLAITWLERVVSASRGRRLSWPEIRHMHPAWSMPADLARMFDWGRLRQLVIDGKWPEAGPTPEEAAWFDVGSFSRWMLSTRPFLPALIDALPDAVSPADARRCLEKLQSAGIGTAA